MKESKKSVLINIFIPCAITLFIFSAIFTMFVAPPVVIEILAPIFKVLQLILGILICTLAVKITKRATHLFIGLVIFCWGILQFFSIYCSVVSLKELWPVYTMITGIILYISGYYKYRKIKFGYVIPAVTIFFMGVWFSLFTFKIIKQSFLELVTVLGPVFMVLVAVALFLFFLIQKRHKELVITDDETGTFSDEEDPFMEIENENK